MIDKREPGRSWHMTYRGTYFDITEIWIKHPDGSITMNWFVGSIACSSLEQARRLVS